jgi:glycine/D-amino acid oxidase-like deaminating enzyme
MKLINDNTCGWINDLPPRTNIHKLEKNLNCEWLIIGAGYTGLSAARKLGELFPKQEIVLVDAQIAGEGSSGRNSGYLVDTTLNDGFTSNKELEKYKKKSDIYDLGIKAVKKFIKEYQVDCDWNECGKYFASSKLEDEKILRNFSNTLSKLKFDHDILFNNDLKKKLGTSFYNVALYTKGGILLHPGKLVRAMVDTLPNNVKLYEYTYLKNWVEKKDYVYCKFNHGSISTKKIIFATNGFLKSLGIKSYFNFPLTLTASMTRSLTDKEFEIMQQPKEWGVLPVRPMGATIRLTKDRRILIRNTAELRSPFKMSKDVLKNRALIQRLGLKKRFPHLPDDIINSTWSGVVSRSRNSSQIFEEVTNKIYAVGCYNGSGIGVGTLFGEQIVLKACKEITPEIEIIEKRNKPTLLPPSPLLDIGVRSRLAYERFKARSEI